MKNQILRTWIIILIAFLTVSCKKDRIENSPVHIDIQLKVDISEIWFQVPFDKAEIILTNKANNNQSKLQANATGKIQLNSLSPGIYDINISLKLSPSEYLALTGQSRETDFYLNFSADNLSLFESKSIEFELINSQPVGGFVIKQIYFAGSHTAKGASIRDHFVEIYNNTSETLYADSLLFVIGYGKTNKNSDGYSLPNNQYDWSKSIGMQVSDNANEDYIYAKAIFMIPSDGSGTKYPVLAGKSIVLAQSALDHTSNYINNSGNLIGVQDPSLTVDLSQADFEVWLYPYEQKIQPGRTMYASDVDNPQVPNVETYFATGMRDMILTPQGRDSYALLKVDGHFDLENIPHFAIPTTREVTTSTTVYPQLPARYILDAVEVEAVIAADRTPRRLPLKLDAGAASVQGGPYSSQSIIRKTYKTIQGRKILQDTNNSAQDFQSKSKADPSKSDSSFSN